ncbi:hypothetical protein OSTOST_25756, partial [Ostertagia ostertagi]
QKRCGWSVWRLVSPRDSERKRSDEGRQAAFATRNSQQKRQRVHIIENLIGAIRWRREDRADANTHRPHFTVDGSASRHNVALISQNIEDNYGARKNIDNMSVSSTLSTLSGCSSESRPTPSLIPVVPPVDYDDPDSGTGGSDSDTQNAESGSFERKVLLKWTCADALQWLTSL